ncbi:MAG: NYN domain-containing protein [Clostridiales bacterium]|nr:NYN domain-containing protein [Clostridiales bacterium]
MKKEYLFVDGYNVIFAWSTLNKIAMQSLENARQKLLDIMCDYQGLKQNILTVVFDAYNTRGGLGSKQDYNNIHVVYTKEFETADNYIEMEANKLAKTRSTIRVVSSDYTEQIIILGRGAVRMSAMEFYHEVDQARKTARKRFIENKPAKKNPLIDLLDSDTANALERLRLDAGDSKSGNSTSESKSKSRSKKH